MNLEGFTRSREPSWRELESLLDRARGRGERLGAADARRMGSLYRGAAADLALARRRFPADPIRARLDELVRRAGAVVYHGRADRSSAREFIARTYWVRVAERPRLLALAALLLLAPALLTALWALQDPGGAIDFIPSEFRGATDPPRQDGGTAGREAAFSALLFTNNIRVTIVAFALGITAGIGTAVLVASNGLLLGAVAGVAIDAGNGRAFLEFIIPHGPIELTCVVVAAAAGLRLGWAVASPGNLPRPTAIAREGRCAAEIVIGTMPWLVLAGLSESYVRGSGLPLGGLMAVGLGLFGAYWGLVWFRGHRWLVVEAARASAEPQAHPELKPALAS